jgi:hypothetical protein
LLEATDSRRFNDYAVSVHFCREPPHLWVTASPQNLVYRGYKGNKMTIILGMSLSIFIVAYCVESAIAANGCCIAGRRQFPKHRALLN